MVLHRLNMEHGVRLCLLQIIRDQVIPSRLQAAAQYTTIITIAVINIVESIMWILFRMAVENIIIIRL